MDELPPVPPSSGNNSKKGVWIAVILVVACLCLATGGILLAGGGYYYLKQTGKLPNIPFFQGRVTATPEQLGPVVVEPFDPASSNIPTLADLATGWTAATSPGTSQWNVSVTPYRQALVFLGWCASTPVILDTNYQHLEWRLTIDDQPVDVNGLYKLEETLSDQVCRTYVGLIRRWPGTTHTIVITQHLDWALNDGWNDYLGGDYIDVYHVTVNP